MILLCLLLTIVWPEVVQNILQDSSSCAYIPGGASNTNYSLKLEDATYFVRIAPQNQDTLYASLDVEYESLKATSELHISPKPLYCDPEKRVLVVDFIESDPETIDLLDPKTRQAVFDHLHAIEKSNITINRTFYPYRDVLNMIEKTQDRCPSFSPEFYTTLLPTLREIEEVLSQDPKKTLCHLDLHHKNILKSKDHYWIIDWEYATMSHPFLVLASMASIERWNDLQMHDLLRDYLKKPSTADFDRLYLYRIAVDIFWTVWCHIQLSCSTLQEPYAEWEKLYYSAALDRVQTLGEQLHSKSLLSLGPNSQITDTGVQAVVTACPPTAKGSH